MDVVKEIDDFPITVTSIKHLRKDATANKSTVADPRTNRYINAQVVRIDGAIRFDPK